MLESTDGIKRSSLFASASEKFENIHISYVELMWAKGIFSSIRSPTKDKDV